MNQPKSKRFSAVAVVLLYGLAGLPLTALAQEQIRVKRLNVEDGLSQGSVNAIVQDRDGFIWLGTQQGLNRYDGFEFRTFLRSADDVRSLPGDWIWALRVDRAGRLWVGTDTGGLARKDPGASEFERYADTAAGAQTISGKSVRSIAEDAEGRVWVGTDGGGLSRLDPATGQIQVYRAGASLSSNRVKALHVDPLGTLWVGTDGGGLLRYDPTVDRFRQVDALARNARVRNIAGGGDGPLWIATYENGLYKLDVGSSSIRHFVRDRDDPRSLASNSLRVLFVDRQERLWIGHEANGLDLYDGDQGFVHMRHVPADLNSIADDHISALYQDRGGVIWVGTQAGISTWNPAASVFSNYARRDDTPTGLSNNWVAGFAEHDRDEVWVATHGGGINLVDLTTGKAQVLRHDPAQVNSLNDDRVFAIVETAAGEIWAGTRASGLNRFDPVTGAWRHYRHDPALASSISFDGVTSVLQDSAGHIWVGTYLGGLNRYVPEIDGFVHYRHVPEDPSSLCMDRVLNLFEDHTGALWISTHGGGLCRLDVARETFTRFGHDPEDPNSLSSDVAWIVTEDTQQNLWVGTADAGVNVWRAEDRLAARVKFSRFGVAEGLISPVVYGLLTDALGRLWIGSNRGLSRIAVRATADGALALHDIRHFGTADGLPGNEFNFAAALRGSDGKMLFGGTAGFTAFRPEAIGRNLNPPNVVLTNFYRLNTAVPFGDPRQGFVLEHTDNLVTFEFAAMDFTAPGDNRYQHQLRGFDEQWVDDGRHHRVTYTNLQAGKYEFRVRAANNDGIWSSGDLIVPLRVMPAPWASGWAYATYAVVLALLAYWFYYAWAQRLAVARQIRAANESLVAEITQRKAHQRALERERATAQRYLDVVEVVILALDAHGLITMVNQKGTRVLGAAEADILGKDFCTEFLPVAEQDEVRNKLTNLEDYAYSEGRLLTKNGVERLLAWRTIRLPESDGKAGGVLMSGMELTQMRKVEAQLRDAQKMEALGTLARGVAHDFNNILSAILGYAELGAATLENHHPAKEYLRKLESSVKRAREIIQGVLTFGRATKVQPESVNLARVVGDAMQLVRPILPVGVTLEEQIQPESGPVLADPSQLTQIALNLCTNACQSMADSGGVLRVSVFEHDIDIEEARTLPGLRPGRHAKLVIADTGPGMDDYTMSRIFEPFFTTRPQGEGTGLGLSVVHGIVSQLHGSIQVHSELGVGTSFEIFLPCHAGLRIAAVEREPAEGEQLHGHGTILFVDDEAPVLEIAQESLSRLGYRVITAINGSDALQRFTSEDNHIDLLITDQTMPGMRGDQVATAVKRLRPEVPVLLMSGADHAAGQDVDAFLSKPYTQKELASKISALLKR